LKITSPAILAGSIVALLALQSAQAGMLIPGTRVGSSNWGANESVNQLFSWANPILGQPDPGYYIDTGGYAWDSGNEVNLIAWFDFGARYNFTALDFATQNGNDGFNRAKLWISDSLSSFTVTNGNTAPSGAPDLNVVLSGAGINFAQYSLSSSVSARYVVAQFLSERVTSTATFHPRAWELRMEGTPAPVTAYWTGTTNNLWSVFNNFATVASGSPNLTGAPDATTNVIFNANLTANFANTELDGNRTIHSLTFGSNATTPVGIGGTDTLTITPSQPTLGVNVQTLSGNHTISSNVVLGANQTWTVTDSEQTLEVSGAVGGATRTLTKAGAGILNLDGDISLQTLTALNGTLNVNGSLTTGTAAVTVTDTVGGAPTTLRFGSVSQTLSSLSIGAGVTVVLTSDPATGAFSGVDNVDKGLSLGGNAAVPEPGTFALLLVGALGGLARRHRGFTPAPQKTFSS
jgi:PEP-CTERM motif